MASSVVTVERSAARRKSRLIADIRKYWLIYALLSPTLVLFLVLHVVPTLMTVPMAFEKYYLLRGIFGSPWIGLGNLQVALNSPDFWPVIRNTVVISLLRLVFGFPAPIILAILTHDLLSERIKRISQSVTYLPYFLSWPIVYGITLTMLNPADGVLITFAHTLGVHPPDVLTSDTLFRPLLVVTGMWKETGWGMIIYLAALAGIPPEMYEAALVDGADWLQRIVYVTLPGILPITVLLLTLHLANILSAGFEQVFIFYSPLTYDVGDIIDTWVYRTGLLTGDFGTATAVGFFKSVIGLILILSANKLARRVTGQGIW